MLIEVHNVNCAVVLADMRAKNLRRMVMSDASERRIADELGNIEEEIQIYHTGQHAVARGFREDVCILIRESMMTKNSFFGSVYVYLFVAHLSQLRIAPTLSS